MSQAVPIQSRLNQPRPMTQTAPGAVRHQVSSGKAGEPLLKLLPSDSISRIAGGDSGTDDAQILPLLAYATGAEASFLVEYGTQHQSQVCLNRKWNGRPDLVSAMGPEIEKLSQKSLETNKAEWRFSRVPMGKYLGVVVPFHLPGGRIVCLGMAVPDLRTSSGPLMAAVMQGYGWWLTSAASVRERERETKLFERVSGFVEMIKHTAAAGDVAEATGLMADHLREILGCQSVSVVGYRRGSYALLASSGGLEVEQRSEGRSALEACVAEAAGRKETFVEAPKGSRLSGTAIGSVAEAARLFNANGWVVTPLLIGDEIIGGWVAFWSEEDPCFEEKVRFLRASAARSAPLLKVVRRSKPEGFPALMRRLSRRLSIGQKRSFILLGVVMAGLGMMPVKEKIKAPASLEPMVRRVVAAPFNATLRETKVEAGDLVGEGDLLAELDGREIRFALAEAVANRARSEKEADRALDAGMIAESQMSRLEARSFEQQQLINEEKQNYLQLRSPIAGVVLQGDLERAEGAPLQTGDRLFEIAPIDTMLIEVALPQREVAFVREGMLLKVQFEAHPGEIFEAEIERIPPRSEVRQNSNVFVCEAVLANPEGRLRPGMNGNAKIVGDRKPFLWTLIRPAVNYCRLKLWL